MKKIEKEIKSIWGLITLHLLPGMALSIVYIIIVKSGILQGYPRLFILGLAGFVTLVPLELGYLFYKARKEVGSLNIFTILGLKSSLNLRQYIFYTVLLLLITGLLMTVLKPLADYFLNNLFSWIPDWYLYTEEISQYSRPFIITTIIISFFFFTLIGPIIEELYFRGFLLARMKWLGNGGLVLNVFLFSVYHFWSPWLIVTRTIAFFPLFYFVRKKDSLKLAILVHCLANFTDVISLIALL